MKARSFLKYLLSAGILGLIVTSVILHHTKSVMASPVTVASDAFTRSVSGGWGSADTGGSYTLSGTASDYNVNGTEGTIAVTVAAAAGFKKALLSSVSRQDVDITTKLKTNKIASGNSQTPYLVARNVASTTEYRGRIRMSAGSAVLLQASKVVSGTETLLGTEVQVSGLTYSANTFINVHMQVTGLNPTTINMRAWAVGNSEPSTWTYTVTDSTSSLQAAGGIGVIGGVGVNTNNLPVTQTFDDLTVTSDNYSISGTIYVDTNENGTQDGGESGYQGAIVGTSSSNTTTTDSSGAYSFTGIAAGTVSVTATTPTGYKSTSTNPVSVTLNADSTGNNIGIQTFTESTSQPSSPYYGTFYYPWFRNPTTDGANTWGTWDDPDAGGSHTPPTNWFSNYLPNVGGSTTFDTSHVYSSNDYTVFKWQMEQMAQAKQEVAISSWWGQSDATNINATTNTILTDFMARSDNPYPNLKWAIYYECEGNTCNGTTDPTVAQITSDLNYIGSHYADSPYYLRVSGKPVIFVYAAGSDTGSASTDCTDSSDTSMTHRWYQAIHNANRDFYYVLKVFSGYAAKPCQPSSWHQYGPSSRTDNQNSYAYAISPGYWKSGDASLLARDSSAFDTAAQNMVNSSATWRLTETWNEWGEGTGIEPAQEVTQAYGASAATANSGGTAFDGVYITVLNNRLPALEHGTGATTATTTSSPETVTSSSTIISSSDQKQNDPNLPPGFKSVIHAGPNHVGNNAFISGAGEANGALTYIGPGASYNDLTITINTRSTHDLENSDPVIPFPWSQGINTISGVYQFDAKSAFNELELNDFLIPVTIILPYDPDALKGVTLSRLRVAEYNTITKRWKLLANPVVLNAERHEAASTVTHFSYFAIGYKRN